MDLPALRNNLFRLSLMAQGQASPDAVHHFRRAEKLLQRMKQYVDTMTMCEGTAGFRFVRVHSEFYRGLSVRVNDDGTHTDITFYADSIDLEDLIQNWWQNVFMFNHSVAYWPGHHDEPHEVTTSSPVLPESEESAT
jgi:hypothetical protein